MTQSSGWITTFLASLWSGGRAAVLDPFALDHHPGRRVLPAVRLGSHGASIDGWIPLTHRETVRGLAREIDEAIAGFVRGQAVSA